MFKKIYTLAALILFMLTLGACSEKSQADMAEDELVSPLCTHDENYIEPTVKTGRYYLNGDKNSYYFDVTESTIELCGTDLGELFDSWQNNSEPVSDDIAQQRENVRNDWIEKWSGKLPYHVETMHTTTDMPTLIIKEIVTPDGYTIGSGLILKDENTLTGFGNEGDFILVE